MKDKKPESRSLWLPGTKPPLPQHQKHVVLQANETIPVSYFCFLGEKEFIFPL